MFAAVLEYVCSSVVIVTVIAVIAAVVLGRMVGDWFKSID